MSARLAMAPDAGSAPFAVKFIHVGHHKCGSTFIQHELIPKLAALTPPPGTRPDGLSNVKFRRAWERMVTCADLFYDPADIIEAFGELEFNCLSNEGYLGYGSLEAGAGGHIEQTARRLRRLFGETRILIVIRNQQRIVRSLYLDDIEYGFTVSFRRWLERRAAQSQLEWFKYAPVVALYRELFGGENVKVVLFEELFRRETLEALLAELDVDAAGLDRVDFSKRVNEGMTASMLSASRVVNRLIGTRANWGAGWLYRQWIDRGRHGVARLASVFGDRAPKLDFPGCDALLVETFGEDNRRLEAMLGRDLGAQGYPVSAASGIQA